MVDVKREDLTLSDWTKGISADEFAWGSYYYSEWISSWYSTKGFELWYKLKPTALNGRDKWYAVGVAPSIYWFLVFTRDGQIETQEFWNSYSTGEWGYQWGWGIFALRAWDTIGNWYLNWVTYKNWAIGIKETDIDVIDYENAFNPASEILTNTDMSDATGWTLGTGWTTTDEGAKHTTGTTGTLTADISSAWLTLSSYCRLAVKITGWTAGSISVDIGNTPQSLGTHKDGWYIANVRWASTTTTLTITPNSSFDWTIQYVNLHEYDTTNSVFYNKVSLNYWTYSDKHPALIWEWDLYIACHHSINIISLIDWGHTHKELIDENYEIVSLTQQAWNIIIWATDGYNSRQYYWNGVDAAATEVIEWKWLIIQSVTGTETISYVLTTSGATAGSVEWYEYRLYAVSWYQRSLIASKLYEFWSEDYLEAPHYNKNKKFDFNDVTDDHWMTIFLDSLYMPWCDGLYKYWYDIAWMRSNWTRPVTYPNGSTHISLGQRGHFLGVAYRADGTNYISNVDNRLYNSNWFLVTEAIYWDKLGTRKALEKMKIWYKNVASTVGWIKVYAIVDDDYFWRFRPTSTPTKRPEVWAVYNIANDTTWEVINVDETNGVITFRTVSNKGSKSWLANTSLTKVSGKWDDTITVGYNFDNMCLIKTIENENQGYSSDLIFWKDFVNNYLPYWHKIQFVVELTSNNDYLSPEIFEISMNSDITDITL